MLLFFSNVSECDLTAIRWNDIKYDRNSSTYRLLHRFCYFIVKGLLLTTERGPYTLRHFDEEMISRLFEKFVLNYYLRHYPMYSINASEVEWNIVPEESTKDFLPKMRTDITIKFPNRTFIIDTKYYEHPMQKHMGKYSINNNHLYQLMAYITNEDRCHLGNVDGMLLYAKTQDEVYPDAKMRFVDGNTLYFQTLDLNQEFGNIRCQLDEFIRPYL